MSGKGAHYTEYAHRCKWFMSRLRWPRTVKGVTVILMKRLAAAGVITMLLVIAGASATAAPASAFPQGDRCGHENYYPGGSTRIKYVSSSDAGGYHWHIYDHQYFEGAGYFTDHTVWVRCG